MISGSAWDLGVTESVRLPSSSSASSSSSFSLPVWLQNFFEGPPPQRPGSDLLANETSTSFSGGRVSTPFRHLAFHRPRMDVLHALVMP